MFSRGILFTAIFSMTAFAADTQQERSFSSNCTVRLLRQMKTSEWAAFNARKHDREYGRHHLDLTCAVSSLDSSEGSYTFSAKACSLGCSYAYQLDSGARVGFDGFHLGIGVYQSVDKGVSSRKDDVRYGARVWGSPFSRFFLGYSFEKGNLFVETKVLSEKMKNEWGKRSFPWMRFGVGGDMSYRLLRRSYGCFSWNTSWACWFPSSTKEERIIGVSNDRVVRHNLIVRDPYWMDLTTGPVWSYKGWFAGVGYRIEGHGAEEVKIVNYTTQDFLLDVRACASPFYVSHDFAAHIGCRYKDLTVSFSVELPLATSSYSRNSSARLGITASCAF